MAQLLTLITFLLFHALPVLSDDEGTYPCPRWRLIGSTLIQPEVRGFEPLKWLTLSPSICFANTTQTVTQPTAPHTTVTLHQTREDWTRDPPSRKTAVLNSITGAITSALSLFGHHAGNRTHPLSIHISVSSARTLGPHTGPASKSVTSKDIVHDQYVTFNTWNASSSPGECELLVGWPYNRSEPLTKMQKNLVKNMYHCVQQWHHPHVEWTQHARPWWHQAIARFFDGMLWPAEVGWLQRDAEGYFWGVERYPEEYDGGHRLGTSNEQAASMFWHWVYESGWDMERITGWMKGRRTGDGREMGKLARNDSYGVWDVDLEDMANDKEMSGLFHSFGRALAMDNVKYPGGQVISGRVGWNSKPWEREWLGNVTDLKVGEERDVYWVRKWPGHERGVQLTPWTVTVIEAAFPSGQVIDVKVGHRDYVVRWDGPKDVNNTINRAANASVYGDVQFSYRPAGEVNLEPMEGGEGRIYVPEGTAPIIYEIFATCTGGTYEYAPLEFRVKRIF